MNLWHLWLWIEKRGGLILDCGCLALALALLLATLVGLSDSPRWANFR